VKELGTVQVNIAYQESSLFSFCLNCFQFVPVACQKYEARDLLIRETCSAIFSLCLSWL
jgi:hypothetical protein